MIVQYRGYILAPTDQGEINIYTLQNMLIDSARSPEEAREIVDGWQNAR